MARRQTSVKSQNWQKYAFVSVVLLLIFAGFFYARQINFPSSDLGRHIKNGEIILTHFTKLSTNFYSFTEPNFPTNTHHWGTGVIYFTVWKIAGFKALSLLNILIHILALYLFFLSAKQLSSFRYAFIFTLLSIPLITYRTEIRPEAFSYLLFAVLFYLLTRWDKKKLKSKYLYLIPFLQVLWVNLHIFFVFGLLITGLWWFYKQFVVRERKQAKFLVIILGLSVVASFVSPYTYKAFVEPFLIFREYGYMIAENQSVLFMQNRFPANMVYVYFEVMFVAGFIGMFILIMKKKKTSLKYFRELVLFIFFSLFAWKMVRGIAFYGFVSIPLVALFFNSIAEGKAKLLRKAILTGMILVYTACLVLFLLKSPLFYPFGQNAGLGVLPGSQGSAEFFKSSHIKGPIFNNYDIGSYLIFHLFPDYRVFNDNRPEAYSVQFFKDIYVPMQEDEAKWKEYAAKYGINVIWFYRHDMTPWAQPFLIRRIRDPEWAPVFVDGFTLILLKRTPENYSLISRYELPQTMFSVTE